MVIKDASFTPGSLKIPTDVDYVMLISPNDPFIKLVGKKLTFRMVVDKYIEGSVLVDCKALTATLTPAWGGDGNNERAEENYIK